MINLDRDPLAQFSEWYEQELAAGDADTDAVTLATASREGRPSARIVLFKGLSKGGFTFYTNYTSRKAREIDENPFVALVFYFRLAQRQVRVEGRAERLSRAESKKYFRSRPRESQIGAWASLQSEELDGREELVARVAKFAKMYKGREVPCPDGWGGYRILPETLELWIGRESRLHDRARFRRVGKRWKASWLFP